jgi:hypothetical protein
LLFGVRKYLVASRVGEHPWRKGCFQPKSADSTSSLGQTLLWVKLELCALSDALSPPCSYVRLTDGGFPGFPGSGVLAELCVNDTFSLIVMDGGWSFASRFKCHAVQAAMSQRERVSKRTAPFKADSTVKTSRAVPQFGNHYPGIQLTSEFEEIRCIRRGLFASVNHTVAKKASMTFPCPASPANYHGHMSMRQSLLSD